MNVKELKDLMKDLDEMYNNTTFYNDNDQEAYWELYNKWNNKLTQAVLKETERRYRFI